MIDFNPLVAAIAAAVVQQLQAQGLVGAAPVQQAVQASYPPQAAPPQQPVYQAPVQQQYAPPQQNTYAPPGTMPGAPFQQQAAPPQYAPQPQQGGYPFTDNVTAAAWAKGVWNQAAAVNQDAAMQKFSALMQGLGAVDFDHLTPDKFPMLFAGIQQIKAEMGIPG